MVSSLLLFNKRRKLVKKFEAWCEQNNADDTDRTNLLTWLYMNDLLNVDKIISFLDNNQNEREEGGNDNAKKD